MTDEEIEKTLRRNADNIGGGFDSRVLDYINRLKADIERIKHNWDIAVSVQRAKWQAKCEQTCKDTARGIIQLIKQVQIMFYDKEYTAIQNLISKKYGVGVDDE